MNLRLLEIFCTVYREASFSGAAQRLGLSQPTVSGHVKALEDFFGVPLFDRLGRSIQPTQAGILLFEHGQKIIDLKQLTLETMSSYLDRLEGRLALGASTIPGEYILPRVVGRFREQYPGIRISLEIHDTREITDRVADGTLQAGFVGAMLDEQPHLQFRPFGADTLTLVTPTGAGWQRQSEVITLEEIRTLPLLFREVGSGTRLALEGWLEDHGLPLSELNIVAELGSTAAIKEAVKEGVGAAFLSTYSTRRAVEVGWIQRLRLPALEKIERRFHRVTNSQRAGSPLRDAFLEFFDSMHS